MDTTLVPVARDPEVPSAVGPNHYEEELERLQGELVKLQYWVKEQEVRVVTVFEWRDAAGKGRLDPTHHAAAEPAYGQGRRAA